MARLFVCLCWFLSAIAQAEAPLLTATEVVLPRYQSLSLDRDVLASDLLLDGSILYVAGERSVWRWDLSRKTLRRVNLLKKSENGGLRGLVSDGIAIMTASHNSVFRIQKDPLKVLKYKHPMAKSGQTIGLTGESDKVFWIHSRAIMHVDRYGRTLIPRYANTGLKAGDKVVFDANANILWIARGGNIQRVGLGDETPEPKTVFDAKNPILGLQLAGTQIMAHTSRSVIRLGGDGSHLGSIPVTGSRSLASMEIRAEQHAYLFTDGLLEVFDMRAKQLRRYRLPLENAERALLSVNEHTVAVIDDGIPRVFSLSQPVE